jgi:ribulose-5-phosphate 4-epimerase/fuculose-1-phosphate aldolase
VEERGQAVFDLTMTAQPQSTWYPEAAHEEERQRVLAAAARPEAVEQKQKLAEAFRVLARVGVVGGLYEGLYGHISLRVPGEPHYFWVNPIARAFAHMTEDDLVLMSGDGKILAGARMHNFAAFFIHSAIHAARPEINCVAHTHPRNGCAFAALDRLLEPIDQVGCAFFEDHALHREYSGVVEGRDQGDAIVESLGANRALILVNHGLLTCGKTVEQATVDMYELERTCEVQLRAMAAGQPLRTIPAEYARQVHGIRTAERRYRGEWMLLMQLLEDEGGARPRSR